MPATPVNGPVSREDAFRLAGGTVREGTDKERQELGLDQIVRDGAPRRPPAQVRPAQGQQLLDVPLDCIVNNPANPRANVGDVSELAESMRGRGLLQPVVAFRGPDDGLLHLVAGHRRVAAARLLGWRLVPCIVRRPVPDDEQLAAMVVENEQRKGLDPIEVAHAYAALRRKGKTLAQIGALVGRTEATVSRRLALLDLPVHEQEALRAGEITTREAVEKAVVAGQVKRGQITAGESRRVQKRGRHFDHDHPLAVLAKARCQRLGKQRSAEAHGSKLPGGQACGPCWEAVIREDTRKG